MNKICNECKEEKPELEFYLDRRANNGRRESKCKNCRLEMMRAKKTQKIKYNILYDGFKLCKNCNQSFKLKEFPINRSLKDGRKITCKNCSNLRELKYRRSKGAIFKPLQKKTCIIETVYKQSNCEICYAIFDMVRQSHKRCNRCTTLTLVIHSKFGKRNNKKIIIQDKISRVNLAVNITKLFLEKEVCHYCNSKFTNDNLKEIDHIVPVSSNGTHCMSNIVIACSHCNRSKNRMDLEKWLFICEKASRLNLEKVSKAAYKSLNENFDGCKICNSKLESNHLLKKYCNECSAIKRKLISSLTSTRKGKPNKFPLSEIVKIISCWKSSKSCIYCNRNFSDLIYKSPDHIIPINLGGENVASNINICCFECNLAKGRISLADWINLSKLISVNLKNILLNKE